MTATTAPVPRPCDRPHGHHDRVRVLVEVDTFNDRAREPTRVLPYALVPHPALPPGSKPSNSSEPKNKAGCTRGSPPTTPTDQAEERQICRSASLVQSSSSERGSHSRGGRLAALDVHTAKPRRSGGGSSDGGVPAAETFPRWSRREVRRARDDRNRTRIGGRPVGPTPERGSNSD